MDDHRWVPEPSMTWLPEEFINALLSLEEDKYIDMDIKIIFGFEKRVKKGYTKLFLYLYLTASEEEEPDIDLYSSYQTDFKIGNININLQEYYEVEVSKEEWILYFTNLFYHDPDVVISDKQKRFFSYEDIINFPEDIKKDYPTW